MARSDRTCANRESDVATFFQRFAERTNGEFLCLPVLIPGEPYDVDAEKRKRISYAVLSALANSGYKPSFPDRLSYIELPVVVDTGPMKQKVSIERLVVPIKLFQPAEERPVPEIDLRDRTASSGWPFVGLTRSNSGAALWPSLPRCLRECFAKSKNEINASRCGF